MNTEQLPEPLNMAVAHIEELRGIIATRYADHTGEVYPSRVRRTEMEVASCTEAIDAILAEHAQRVTLQHHAADQAQRITELIRYSDEGIAQAQAALQERIALDQANRNLAQRVADLEAERDELRRDCAELRNSLALETVALRSHLDGDKDREIERLKAALYSIDRQLGHDDADDALRDEITAAPEAAR